LTGATGPFAAAVVVAAGRGQRFGASDKVLLPIGGRPMLAYVLDAIEEASTIGDVVVVVGEHIRHAVGRLMEEGDWTKVRTIVIGGELRQQSVAAGVEAVPVSATVVAIHDGARPLATAALFDRCTTAAAGSGAAIVAVPVVDTLKRVEHGRVVKTVDRADLWAAQTPQAFRRDLLRDAIIRYGDCGALTDEAGLCEALGMPVQVVPGSAHNVKVTLPEDLFLVEALLRARSGTTEPAW
jgi:2-C-methyl-D-erythritol 4-phosphate cytidylyltransferase